MLKTIPFRFRGLDIIGSIVFFLNFGMFWLFLSLILCRFILIKSSLKLSLLDPTESPFMPTLLMTWSTIVVCVHLYGTEHCGPWIITCLRILYWIHVAVSLVQGIAQYLFLFAYEKVSIHDVSPTWLFIILPSVLGSVIASNIAESQPQDQAIPIIISGITILALGFNVSMIVITLLILRLIMYGLPPADIRPALFIIIGPISFSGLSMIGLGKAAHSHFAPNFISTDIDSGAAFEVLGFSGGLFTWTTCFWFFCISFIAVIHGAIVGMKFRFAWCALVFPNVGFTILTIYLGEALDSNPVKWVGTIMATCVTVTYLFCLLSFFYAFANEQIIAPGNDENHPYNFKPMSRKRIGSEV